MPSLVSTATYHVGCRAASYTKKGLAFTFHLRQGVKSCAGNELTADDVVYTFARAKSVNDTRGLLPRIDVPTLLIWGEADQRSPLAVAERMREGIPGAELIVLADAGHESNVEQPAAFNAAVLDFCRRVEHPDGSVRP